MVLLWSALRAAAPLLVQNTKLFSQFIHFSHFRHLSQFSRNA
jgi:hypothetical protein